MTKPKPLGTWKIRYAKWMMTKGINFWAPFLGAGIRVVSSSEDMTSIKVTLKSNKLNMNIMGVHFGGSIYAMCDPFYMGMLMHHLGPEYLVWDKGASIRFKKPGTGTLSATFEIPIIEIAKIKARADDLGKTEETFFAKVLNSSGEVVAEVDKIVWIRNKSKKKPQSS